MAMDKHRATGELRSETLSVPLYVGQDSSMDQRVLEPGASALVENGRLFFRGQVRKRFGFTAQSQARQDGSTVSMGTQVMSGGSTLFQADGANINVYSQNAQAWNAVGRACGGQITSLGAIQSINSVVSVSSAATAKYQVIVWTEGAPGPLYYSVIDLQTGAQLVARYKLSEKAQAPCVLQQNGNFYLMWGSLTAAPQIIFCTINSATPYTLSSQISLPAIPSLNTQYDAIINNQGTGILFACEDASQGSTLASVTIGVYSLTFAGAATLLGTMATGLPSGVTTQPNTINFTDDGTGTVLGAVGVATVLNVYKPGGLFVTVGASFGAAPAHRMAFSGNVLFVEYAPYGCIRPYTVSYVSAAYALTPNAVNPIVAQNGLHLISRAFSNAGNSYVWVVSDTSVQSLNILLDQAGGVVGINGANGQAAPYDGKGLSLSTISNDGSGNFTFTSLTTRQIQVVNGLYSVTSVGIASRRLSLSVPRSYAQQVGDVTYFGNCAPQIYDGAQMTEWGFYYYPEVFAQASTGGSLTGGNYQVSAVYSWYDNTGKIWRSATSFIQTVTVAAGGSITVTLPYLWLTTKTNVQVEIYCSANIGGQTGQTLYLAQTIGNTPPAFTADQPTTGGITVVVIGQADASIATGIPLYISGGVPSYITPPSLTHLSSSGLRLYGTSGEDNQIYVTVPATPGLPLNYVLTQSVSLQTAHGTLVGSQPQDGNLWIATMEGWYLTNADTNSLSAPVISFNPPARQAFGDGCISAPSIIASAAGIYYQSHRGIELITRGQQAQFVGEPIKNVTDQVLDAYNVPGQQQLRFVTQGLQLCYDYERNTWLQHAFGSAPTLVSGCRWNNLGVIATPDGTVRLENLSSFFDDVNIPVILRVQTPWIRMSGVAGWGKLWEFYILGELESPHTLVVNIAYEDDPSWQDKLTVASSQVYGTPAFGNGLGVYGTQSGAIPPAPFGRNPAGNAYKWNGIMPRADGGSFKFEITETNSTGEDLLLNIIAFLYGVQSSSGKFPVRRTFG